MIELLAGAAVGWLAGNFVHHRYGSCLVELRDENRALREVIRYAARTCPNVPLRRYLQRALDDEAGA